MEDVGQGENDSFLNDRRFRAEVEDGGVTFGSVRRGVGRTRKEEREVSMLWDAVLPTEGCVVLRGCVSLRSSASACLSSFSVVSSSSSPCWE